MAICSLSVLLSWLMKREEKQFKTKLVDLTVDYRFRSKNTETIPPPLNLFTVRLCFFFLFYFLATTYIAGMELLTWPGDGAFCIFARAVIRMSMTAYRDSCFLFLPST